MLSLVKLAATAGALTAVAISESTTPGFVVWGGALVLLGAICHQVLAPAGRAIYTLIETLKVMKRLETWMPAVDGRLDRLEAAANSAENSAAATARELGAPARRHPRPRST